MPITPRYLVCLLVCLLIALTSFTTFAQTTLRLPLTTRSTADIGYCITGYSEISNSPLATIFAPETPTDYIEQIYQALDSQPQIGFFNLNNHWNPSSTATNDGASSAQGEPLTLTYSFIPDGTNMPVQFTGDQTCTSSLIANFNSVYGNGNWQAEIAEVFAQWEMLTGNQYLFEPNDDGAAWPGSIGNQGVRGDIRIGGCAIDGNSGILGYNFFPSNGDMKIESTDSFFKPANLTTGFNNIFAHEHGHGAGIEHVCPANRTKLMEPFVTVAFIGLQHDDTRAAQRLYGDVNEAIGGGGNDSASQATDLGAPADFAEQLQDNVSIDDNGDEDWYAFSVGSNRLIDINLTPVGLTYFSDPQNTNGSCPSPTNSVNSLAMHNLSLQVRDSNGSTVLTTVNATGAGSGETLSGFSLGAAGVKYIRVTGSSANDIQLYELTFTIKNTVNNLLLQDNFEN